MTLNSVPLHDKGVERGVFTAASQPSEYKREDHYSKIFNKKKLQIESPAGTWNAANAQR